MVFSSTCLSYVVLGFLVAALPTAQGYVSPIHIFSTDDVIGDFDGNTFADDPSILCGTVEGSPDCPDGTSSIPDDGVTLYPIDSEFGFEVLDFVGAVAKERNDGAWDEGFAGNVMDGPTVVGLAVANFATDTYRTPARYGTWCQGLGGTSVKCSSEHYAVMEHVLTCHESVPYSFADPETGEQAELMNAVGTVDCGQQALDNRAIIVEDGVPDGGELDYLNPFNSMIANDNTDVLNDIAVTDDFSVTLKDDGKLLYRWGNLIKRPNDVRLYAKLELPAEWKARDSEDNLLINDFSISKAHLIVRHWITNNPNDQLRAEDLENEGATGRKPDHLVVPVEGLEEEESWLSLEDCYEGDADFIDGTIDATPIDGGTVLKNNYDIDIPAGDDPPQYQSADLLEGFTNAWYTTINRDPFEWSYLMPNDDSNVVEYAGEPLPLTKEEEVDKEYELISGPRWRLKANKFGQDLPGLEIPRQECSEPPFQRDNIKYEVGELTTTIINLLDWEDDTDSPLLTSQGWVDYTLNAPVVEGVELKSNGKYVSRNGLPMTEDFDLAVYIKGDKKPTRLFDAKLDIEYEGEPPSQGFNLRVLPPTIDPPTPTYGVPFTVTYSVANDGPDPFGGGVNFKLSYSDNKQDFTIDTEIVNLDLILPRGVQSGIWSITVPLPTQGGTRNAQIRAFLPLVFVDLDPTDNEAVVNFQIKK